MDGLLLTLLLGLFIVVGAFIVFLTKNNTKFIDFSIALAAGVIFMLLWIDILPEAYEGIEASNGWWKALYILAGTLIGFSLLKGLDHFIPDHEDDLTTDSDDRANLKHIGLMSSVALVLHNIVEGMAIYTLTVSDFTAGIMASLGVGLHNIPLGMVIASTFYQTTKDKKKTWWLITLISLSTFFKDYVYIPLGGNRCSTIKNIRNILIVWMLTGLWHGASWNFIIWGIYFGIILILEKFVLKKYLEKMSNFLRHLYSILLILIGWLIFAFEDMNVLLEYSKRLFGFETRFIDNDFLFFIKNYLVFIVIAMIFSTPITRIIKEKIAKARYKNIYNIGIFISFLFLFMIVISFLVSDTYNPFLYFRF